jgi:hypothetical protein
MNFVHLCTSLRMVLVAGESDPGAQQVLAHHFPGKLLLPDVKAIQSLPEVCTRTILHGHTGSAAVADVIVRKCLLPVQRSAQQPQLRMQTGMTIACCRRQSCLWQASPALMSAALAIGRVPLAWCAC